jgi:predicted esterase
MFGTPGDQIIGLTRRLRQEGYCVLRMMSQPSRFTENTSYALPAEGDFGDAVPAIAADLTDRAAEAAYAVEAAVLYAKQERPALRNVPRVAIGMSGGAMLLPIVLSREPGAYAGAVSIAGGVDYLKILTTSNYANWIDAVRVTWLGPTKSPNNNEVVAAATASAKRVDELSAAYRKLAPLDSANLVGSLKSVPWLLLHGSLDKAVPAGTGDELWELLGKPERIVIKGGHEWVFMTLAGKYNAIADWLNKRVPSRPQPVGSRP